MNHSYEVTQTQGEVLRATGRRYDHLLLALESLPPQALRDLTRLIRDLKDEVSDERRRRKRGQFWG